MGTNQTTNQQIQWSRLFCGSFHSPVWGSCFAISFAKTKGDAHPPPSCHPCCLIIPASARAILRVNGPGFPDRSLAVASEHAHTTDMEAEAEAAGAASLTPQACTGKTNHKLIQFSRGSECLLVIHKSQTITNYQFSSSCPSLNRSYASESAYL